MLWQARRESAISSKLRGGTLTKSGEPARAIRRILFSASRTILRE